MKFLLIIWAEWVKLQLQPYLWRFFMDQTQKLSAVAERIRQRRIELKLSLQDVSELSGMSRSTLQRYETGGIRNIPLQNLDRLAKALNTSPDWILGWTQNAGDITPVDAYFKNLLESLGFQIQSWPGLNSRIYFYGENGSGEITREEYEQFRDNVSSYIKFTALNLLNKAMKREKERIAKDLKKYDEVFQHNEEKSANTEE